MTSSRNGQQDFAADPMTGAWARPGPIVGRDREIATVRGVRAAALSGHGRLVLVSGEAGIGKTALVRQICDDVASDEFQVLSGACYDLTITPPYGPWIDALKSYAPSPGSPKPPTSMVDPDSIAGLPSKPAFFDEALKFLHGVASHTPLAVVLEDLHWSDQSSLELLRVVARNIGHQRILLIATYRDDEITRDHPLFLALPNLIRESHAVRIELLRLSVRDTRRLIPQYYALPDSDLNELVAFLARFAEGNPLFIREQLRHLELRGILQQVGEEWRLTGLEQASVPSLIQQMVAVRLARAGHATISAIETAAVIGQHVPLGLLESFLDQHTLTHALDDAKRTGLVEVSVTSERIEFRHALVRAAIYDSIPLTRRRALHQQIAEVSMRQAGPDSDSIAYHLLHAGSPDAVDWLIQAGEKAEQQFAWHEAIDRYKEAIGSIQQSPDEGVRVAELNLRIGELLRFADPARGNEYLTLAYEAAIASDQGEISAHALFGIGQNLCNLGDPEPGLAAMRDAIAATTPSGWNTTDNDRPLRRIDPAHGQPEAWFKGNYAYWLAAYGRINEANAVAEANLSTNWRQAARAQEFNRIASASLPGNRNTYVALGHALALSGRPDESRLAFDLALEINRGARFEPHNVMITNQALIGHHFPYRAHKPDERARLVEIIDRWLRTSEGMVTDRFLPGYEYVLLWEGRWEELKELSRANPDPTLFPYWSLAMCTRASLARFTGDPDAAWDFLTRLLPEGPRTEPGAHVHLVPGEAHRIAAGLAVDAGNCALARVWIAAHDRWLEWSGAIPGRADGTLIFARINQIEGDIDAARSLASQALKQASDPEQPLSLISIHRFLGELNLASSDYDGAERHLERSAELGRACRVPFEQALTDLAFSELHVACGNGAAALSRLNAVRETCANLGASPARERAERLQRTIHNCNPDQRYGLSPREQEVLALIAQGMTDRQVAERLFISHRTVMRHVSHILRKLNVESRTAAAAMAVREDLL